MADVGGEAEGGRDHAEAKRIVEACSMWCPGTLRGPAGGFPRARGVPVGRSGRRVSRQAAAAPARRRSRRPEASASVAASVEGEAAVAARVLGRGTDEGALGAGHEEGLAGRRPGGAGLVDDALGQAVRLAGREHGVALRVQGSRPAGIRERDPRAGLEGAVAQPRQDEDREQGTDHEQQQEHGQEAHQLAPVGDDERLREGQDVGPELLEAVDDHGRMLPAGSAPWRGSHGPRYHACAGPPPAPRRAAGSSLRRRARGSGAGARVALVTRGLLRGPGLGGRAAARLPRLAVLVVARGARSSLGAA